MTPDERPPPGALPPAEAHPPAEADPPPEADPPAGADLPPEARRRVAAAVHAGRAVADTAEAAAAVRLARLAQARLRAGIRRAALRISAGMLVVWLVVVALPFTLAKGVHPGALAGGLVVAVLLYALVLLLGRRQLRLARRAEVRNQRLLDGPERSAGR